MGEGQREREGDTESEAGSRLWAASTEPNAGLQPTNHKIMTWGEDQRLTNWATQVPPTPAKKILKGRIAPGLLNKDCDVPYLATKYAFLSRLIIKVLVAAKSSPISWRDHYLALGKSNGLYMAQRHWSR